MGNRRFISLLSLIAFAGTIFDIFYLSSSYDIVIILLLGCWLALAKNVKWSGEIFVVLALLCFLLMVFSRVIGSCALTLGCYIGEKAAEWAFLFFVLALYAFVRVK